MMIQYQKIKNIIINYSHALLIILCFLYLLPSLTIGFIPDDVKFAVFYNDYGFFENLKNIWLSPNEFFNKSYSFKPIIYSISLIEYSIWGINPFWYHLTNIFFHIFNVILIYQFSFALLRRRKLSFICALIFIIHPIMTNSMFWVYSKTELVACGFYLLSLITLFRYFAKEQLSFLILSQLFFFFVLLSKDTSIVLPFAQYCLVAWEKNKLVEKGRCRRILWKLVAGNILTVLFFSLFLISTYNQARFFITDNYNLSQFSQFLTNPIISGLSIFLPFNYNWFETILFEKKYYLIVFIIPLSIRSLFFIYSNNKKYYKYIILIILLFIPILFTSSASKTGDTYLASCFFAIFLGAIIYRSYQNSKIIFLVLIFYASTLFVGSINNYKVWLDNTLINKMLVNGLENEMNENPNFNTYVVLNFPSKINYAPTLTIDLEPFMNLRTKSNRRIVNPVFIAHDNDIKPTAIHYSNEGFIINACEESSYFLLNKKSYSPGEVLDIKNGKIIIQKINKKGKAVRIILKLNNDLLGSNICYLYFDENSLEYKIFDFSDRFIKPKVSL
ncbi:MAG: ArnT family glycosyltransferase [Candidatus Neomarinimicrobiota bacterium]